MLAATMTSLTALTITQRGAVDAPVLLATAFSGEEIDSQGLPERLRRTVAHLSARAGWGGKLGQTADTESEGADALITLLGLGSRSELTPQRLDRALSRRLGALCSNGATHVALLLPSHRDTSGAAAERLLTQLALAGYRFDRYKSKGSRREALERIDVVPPVGTEQEYESAAAASRIVARSAAYARDLGNTPGNEASPAWIEQRARELAAEHQLEITVLDAAELAKRGMGGLLAVGAGSTSPPRLLRLRRPASGRPRIALVGKGVTFDTGGISIKPAANLEQMKFDKSGACTVLAALRGACELALPLDLTVYTPVAENMLSAAAYRPGDIVRCYNGTTVEITNTDAEGRMILADALSWAAEEHPEAIVELSTLTGACVIALGHFAAGLFSPDDRLAAEITAAGEHSGERFWRLPLYPEYLEEMRSHHADLRNSADRWGGACNAAAFLSQFMGDVGAWAHLDIAGVAHLPAGDRHGSRATAFGVATLLSWLRQRASPS
jgi:leucyl aminopeptidase